MRTEAELIEAYLLGELNDEDRSAVEDRMFPDDGFFDRIEFYEDELIDAYLRGILSSHQRNHFEIHFLESPRRKQLLAMARSQDAYFAHAARVENKKSWWTRIRGTRRNDASMLRLAFAGCTAALIFGVLSIWLTARLSHVRDLAARQQLEAQQEIARLEQETKRIEALRQAEIVNLTTPALTTRATMVSLVLLPGLLRGIDERTLVIPTDSQTVRLLLESTYELPAGNYLVAVRDASNGEVWRKSLRLSQARKPPLPVELGARVLASGAYTLSLSRGGADAVSEPPLEYAFSIKRVEP